MHEPFAEANLIVCSSFKHTSTRSEGLWLSNSYDVLVFCARASFNVWARRRSRRANACVRTNEPTTSSKRLWRRKAHPDFPSSSDPFTLIEEAQQDLCEVKTTFLLQDAVATEALIVLEEERVRIIECLLLSAEKKKNNIS